jgi:phosphodiester glycosidase
VGDWHAGIHMSRFALTFAAWMLLGFATNPAPASHPPARAGPPRAPLEAPNYALLMAPPEGHLRSRHRPAESSWRVVASSELAPGVRFQAIRLSTPPQQIDVITVTPQARVRAALVQAGPDWAPFATVSSAVARTHALAGTNGYFQGPPAHTPMLVRDGQTVPSSPGALRERHPRTGLGLTEDGSAMFVTVDGRRASAVGMTLQEFAAFMQSMGAVWAINLDGGASTTMVVRGAVANSPSDPNGERRVRTAVVILSSRRPGILHLARQLHQLDNRIVLAFPLPPRSTKDLQ